MSDDLAALLGAAVTPERVQRNLPLAQFTTFKVGGPADWLVHAQRADDVKRVLALARDAKVPVVVLGGGSNVLIADSGIRGIVIRIHGGEAVRLAPNRIKADAGITINGLVRWTIARGTSGLEMWAGTPGTVGGAIHGNAHFKGRLIGDLVETVEIVTPGGAVETIARADMEFAYDRSRLQRTREVVLSVDFHCGEGDPPTLRGTARDSLAYRKRTQPLETPSAGCIFQNPDSLHDRVPEGIPASAGALVDRAGLKGHREGGARVSPTHGNFIVNDGQATAEQIRRLIERCRMEVRERFGVELRDEIVYLGF